MPRCRIHNCKKYPYQPCCKGCWISGVCQDRCFNDPDRCNCSVEGALPAGEKPCTKKRARTKRPTYDWERMRKLRAEGKSFEEIAAELGCNKNSVRYALRKMKEENETWSH